MTVEGYSVSLKDIVNNVDPSKRGDRPVLKAEPGAIDVMLTRIEPTEDKTLLFVYCAEDNSETRIYRFNPKNFLTSYGETGKVRMLVVDSDDDPEFVLNHESTLFPNSTPIYYKVEDEVGNRGWLMLVHT